MQQAQAESSDCIWFLHENGTTACLNAADGRTCLHAAVSRGDADELNDLLEKLLKKWEPHKDRAKNLLKQMDRLGDTVMHLAVRRNRLDMVKLLLHPQFELASFRNRDKETAIHVAVKLGFLPLVQELLQRSPESIQITSNEGKNILHLAVEHSEDKILQFLVEKKNDNLLQLINQHDEPPIHNTQGQQEDGNQSGGDTALHIAARNKNFHMVSWLLKVHGVNRDAVNRAGLTPLDIARKNTEYDEPYYIIEKLSVYPSRRRPFLYNAPTKSAQKHDKAVKILDKMFNDRRDVELVVATLLATMTFTAVFTVPGGFSSESAPVVAPAGAPGGSPAGAPGGSPVGVPEGVPLLIREVSFKLFLIFDCLAFFLSIFVVLMWEMSSPLTARDKMLFIYFTNGAACLAFAFTASSLTAAVYTMLAHKVKRVGATIGLVSCMFLISIGVGLFFYMGTKFLVRIARFHRLCGVPCVLDNFVEKCWVMAENHGILDVCRRGDYFCHRLIWGRY